MAYIDVKDEGTDRLCLVLAKIFGAQYNEKKERIREPRIYITDIILSKENVDITIPLCAGLLNTHHFNYVGVESNNQGSIFLKDLRKLVPAAKVIPINNQTNKMSRIINEYAFINAYCYFLHDADIPQDSEYEAALQEIGAYNENGKNEHDDAPDALSGLCKFIQRFLPYIFK